MDCKEFQEYVSPLVDNQIDELKKTEAENHLIKCPSCYFDYKIESLVKKIVAYKFQKSSCPEILKNQIIFSLVSKRSFSDRIINYLSLIFGNKYFRISFALGVLAILALAVFDPFPDDNEKYYRELATIVYKNCEELRNHNFPEKTIFSSNHNVVMNFIVANGISNPKMPKTNWSVLAAGIERHNNYIAAHLLFKCEKDTVYLMECDVEKIYKSDYLKFFKKIHNHLTKQKFVKIDHSNCSIIFRIENGVLMAYAMSSDNVHLFEELVASLD